MHRLRVLLLVLITVAPLHACDRLARPDTDDVGLSAHAQPPYLVLENGSDRAIYHAVFDGAVVDEILWLACADPSCPGIEPGERDSIHYDDIGGDGTGPDEAVVYWWHLDERSPDRFEVDSMLTIRIDL